MKISLMVQIIEIPLDLENKEIKLDDSIQVSKYTPTRLIHHIFCSFDIIFFISFLFFFLERITLLIGAK